MSCSTRYPRKSAEPKNAECAGRKASPSLRTVVSRPGGPCGLCRCYGGWTSDGPDSRAREPGRVRKCRDFLDYKNRLRRDGRAPWSRRGRAVRAARVFYTAPFCWGGWPGRLELVGMVRAAGVPIRRGSPPDAVPRPVRQGPLKKPGLLKKGQRLPLVVIGRLCRKSGHVCEHAFEWLAATLPNQWNYPGDVPDPPPPYPALQRIHSAARNSPPHAPRGNSRKKITKSNQTHTPKYPIAQ